MSAKSMCRVGTLALAASILAAAPVIASPINYQESVSGDLQDNGTFPILAFDVGTNTVGGNLGVGEHDSFAFSIPVGAVLFGASVVFTDAAGLYTATNYDFRTGNVAFAGTVLENFTVNSPGTHTFAAVPQLAGTYHLLDSVNASDGGPVLGTADYTFSFDVRAVPAAVPEPASMTLLLTGLAGVGARRWRHRRR
jgi:hypothetical protein